MRTDPARIFRDADRVSAPDLWSDIEGRETDGSPQPKPGSVRRIAVAMLALVIGAGGFAFAVRAFTGPSVPAAQPLSPAISYSPTEVATIDVGPKAQTNAILSAAGSVWVTAYGVKGGGGVDRDMLFRIDPVTQEITARIPLDTAPTSAFGDTGVTYADGSIWVTGGGQLQDGHTQAVLDRIDPSTNKVTASIGLGGRFGSDVAVNDAGVWVGIFTQDNGNVQVVRVDPATNEVTDRIDLQSTYLRSLVAVSGYVMAEELEWSHGSGPCGLLTTIDVTTDEIVAHEPVGASCGMAGLDVWGGRIWADLDGRFVQLDPSTTKPVGEGLAFGPNHSPRGFLVQDDTGIWYAAYPGDNGNGADVLSRMDPVTGQIDNYMDLKHGPISATLLGESLWTVNYDGTATGFDLVNGTGQAAPEPNPQIAARVPVGQWPGSVAVGEGSVWVLAHEDDPWRDFLVRIDPQTNETVARIPLENAHSSLAAGAGAVWIASFGPDGPRLLRVDPAMNRVGAVIPGISGPVAAQSDAVWAFADDGNSQETTLVRIDPASNQIVGRIPIPHVPPPFDIVATEDSVWILLSNAGGDASDVLKIDTRSNEVVPTGPLTVGSIWMAADSETAWVQDGDGVLEIDAAAGHLVANVPFQSNFRPFAVADGGVWFLGGPQRPTGICRLNSVTLTVDVCVDPGEGADLELAHDLAAYDATTDSIWVPNWHHTVTRIDLRGGNAP